MGEDAASRAENYLRKHNLEAVISDAVLDAVLADAPEPMLHISAFLRTLAAGAAGAAGGSAPLSPPAGLGGALKAVTWNIAAINNNPFEYWITHDDSKYAELMAGVQGFITEPGERDVPVEQVFSAERFAALKALMAEQGWCAALHATLGRHDATTLASLPLPLPAPQCRDGGCSGYGRLLYRPLEGRGRQLRLSRPTLHTAPVTPCAQHRASLLHLTSTRAPSRCAVHRSPRSPGPAWMKWRRTGRTTSRSDPSSLASSRTRALVI